MFDQILSIVFPEKCRNCNKSGTALCAQCRETIPAAAIIIEPAYGFAVWDYHHSLVRQAIWELKYHRKSPVAKTLALNSGTAITDYISDFAQGNISQAIILVPIPQHSSKTRERGFNQSTVIAKWFRTIIPGSTVVPLLHKTRATLPQAHATTRQDRQKNLTHSMQVTTALDPKALYIVVDDVITTGSTIKEASRALRAAGAKHICAIALAHGYGQRN